MSEADFKVPLEEIGYYDYTAKLGMPYFHWGGIQTTDRLVELLKITSDSKVLMVGSGTGYTACYIADKTGCSFTGVDISPWMVKRSNERIDDWNLESRVVFQHGDAHNLEFSDSSFDDVMTEFVSVFLNKTNAFSEYNRVLQSGGKVGINELYVEDDMPQEASEKIMKATEGFEQAAGLPLKIPTKSDWSQYFSNAGFTDLFQEIVTYKYSFGEMRRVAGLGKLLRMSGRTIWDMMRNKKFRKRMWPIGQLKDVLVRNKTTRDYAGALLSIGVKTI